MEGEDLRPRRVTPPDLSRAEFADNYSSFMLTDGQSSLAHSKEELKREVLVSNLSRRSDVFTGVKAIYRRRTHSPDAGLKFIAKRSLLSSSSSTSAFDFDDKLAANLFMS